MSMLVLPIGAYRFEHIFAVVKTSLLSYTGLNLKDCARDDDISLEQADEIIRLLKTADVKNEFAYVPKMRCAFRVGAIRGMTDKGLILVVKDRVAVCTFDDDTLCAILDEIVAQYPDTFVRIGKLNIIRYSELYLIGKHTRLINPEISVKQHDIRPYGYEGVIVSQVMVAREYVINEVYRHAIIKKYAAEFVHCQDTYFRIAAIANIRIKDLQIVMEWNSVWTVYSVTYAHELIEALTAHEEKKRH
jgi:hypothetical protein